MASPVPMKYYEKAQSTYQPPQIAPSHFLGDLYTSTDEDKPITSGLYKFEAGKELVYEYTYHEMKIILEGEVYISDQTGQKVHAKAGDSFYFPKGSIITFDTPTKGLAFFVGQRKEGGA
ncbi:putative ethanolamine utilization protein [Phaeomoniella chlamydospora]|uniref:Putative ethanolamine utilization protein n=1 Tax=Phaeomoniella chlamydospora TaxID=158046 RepID=A0A0G2EK69_PHACM|nr:putative ethanolamine utilization protein [Phaeomoniella chlamydospora]